ncbi:hypothetical protein D7Y24_13465 [Stenotrophomonas maltophilia]|nr:hypothetical protein [Stenotrophomonas maltophilia]PSD17966.1 hypothetical protein C7E19_04105 [Stenotrophomonas maltophilia]
MKSPACRSQARRCEQHRDHAAVTRSGGVRADRGEVHALRKADDLCHGANVAAPATSLPTMISGVFQGEA